MINIAIIGAGFTGLSAAYYALEKNAKVTIFEKDIHPGGLAVGWKEKNWKWSLENHYHHWFANDDNALLFASDLSYPVVRVRPKTSIFVQGKSVQLDSPISVLRFPYLSFLDRVRMGISLGILRINPFWSIFEGYKSEKFLIASMGRRSYKMIWKPQLYKKFGKNAKNISLSWFWARIKKRTPQLLYPKGGFLTFAHYVEKKIMEKKGRIFYNANVKHIAYRKNKVSIIIQKGKKKEIKLFDSVLVTVPSQIFTKMSNNLPLSYIRRSHRIKWLSSVNLILRLKKQFMKDNTYWLSNCSMKYPALAVVEHTNFIHSRYYGNEHIVYVGNYVPLNHPIMHMKKEQILNYYDSFLSILNRSYKKHIISYVVKRAIYAQPIVTVDYKKNILPFVTPIKNVYLANMEQVYPWDRGTNYAIKYGKCAADAIMSNYTT